MNIIEPTLQHTLSHDTVPGAPLKASDLDFYNLLRRQTDESRLFFNQRRAVIFDVEAIGALRQQLIESLGMELAIGILARFGYSQGQRDAAMLAENFNWETEMDWLAAGPSLNMLEGMVHAQPEFIEFNRETGYFYMHGAWLNSYEAEEHLRRFGVSSQPVCWTLTGYASGYTTRFFGQELLAIETECVGKGDARCYWEIRPVAAWGIEAEPYLTALKQIDISNQLQQNIAELKQAEEVNAERVRLSAFTAEIGLALTQGTVLTNILKMCAEVMVKHLDAAFARIWTFNPTENVLDLQASAGIYTHIDGSHGRVPVGKFKIGLIAQERKPHLTNDVLHDPLVGDKVWAEREGMVAFAGYPLIVEDRLVGVMAIFARHTLADTVLDAMQSVANMVALSIERKKAEQTLAKRAAELETIARVSTATASLLDTDKLLQEVVDLTKQSFYLYHAHIYLLNKAEHKLELAAGAGEVGRKMVAQGWAIPLDREHSLVAQAARTQHAVIVNDVRLTPDFMPNPLLPETRSEMAVPLMVGDTVLGVLDVQAEVINRFTEEDKQISLILAGQIAVALRNANLYQQTQAALTNLNQSQELLRATIDATPDWIFIKDRQHRYQLVNQAFAQSLQLPIDIIIGKNDLEVGYSEDTVKGNPEQGIRGYWNDDDEVMDSGRSKFIESEPGVVNDQPVFLSTIKVPLFDSTGNVWGILGIVRDITQREQLLAEAEKLYEASRRINEASTQQEIVAAIIEELSVPAINRGVLLMFEYDSLGMVEIMTVTANWHSGKGNLPTPIGVQYSKAALVTLGLLFSTTPLFLDDIQHDERIDPVTLTLLQQLGVQSMVVLPLWAGSRQLGSLLLETEELYKFTERDILLNRSLVSQAAVAIDNLRLLEETRTALAEVEATQRRYTVQTWDTYRHKLDTLSYEHVREGVSTLGDDLLPVINRVMQEQQQVTRISTGQRGITRPHAVVSHQLPEQAGQLPASGSSVVIPLIVRGEPVGVLGLQETNQQRVWSPEEIALIEAISEQLAQAAENIRLIDESQQQAAREKRVNEIGEKIQAAQSLEEALKIAVKEVGVSLQASQTVAKLELK